MSDLRSYLLSNKVPYSELSIHDDKNAHLLDTKGAQYLQSNVRHGTGVFSATPASLPVTAPSIGAAISDAGSNVHRVGLFTRVTRWIEGAVNYLFSCMKSPAQIEVSTQVEASSQSKAPVQSAVSASIISAIPLNELQESHGLLINGLPDEECRNLKDSVLNRLNGSFQARVLNNMSAEEIGKLSAHVINELTDDELHNLSAHVLNNLSCTALSGLQPYVMRSLSKETVSELNERFLEGLNYYSCKPYLNNNFVCNLSPDLDCIPVKIINNMISDYRKDLEVATINRLSDEALSLLSPKVLRELSKDKLRLLDARVLNAVYKTHGYRLEASVLNELPNNTLSQLDAHVVKLGQLSQLSAHVLNGLSDNAIRELGFRVLKVLPDDAIKELKAEFFNALSPDTLGELDVRVFDLLPKETLDQLSDETIAYAINVLAHPCFIVDEHGGFGLCRIIDITEKLLKPKDDKGAPLTSASVSSSASGSSDGASAFVQQSSLISGDNGGVSQAK